MKKKVLSVCLVVVIAVMAIAGASLAYLTDDDSARNVMTIGNLDIDQNEKQISDVTGEMEDFQQNKTLVPAVVTGEVTKDNIITTDETTGEKVFNSAIKNVVDKFVSVTNNGNQSAFIRTIIAFEGTYETHENYIGVNGTYDYVTDENGDVVEITLNGVTDCLAVCVYKEPVAANTTKETSLRQIYLASEATNSVVAGFGVTYDILVISQAVQVAGFEELGAEYALNTAFGEITATTAAAWFAGIAG